MIADLPGVDHQLAYSDKAGTSGSGPGRRGRLARGVGWRAGLEGWAFVSTATAGRPVATFCVNLYPNVMRLERPAAFDLTIGNSPRTPYTLKVMTIVALIFTPIVLAYQGWTYWVFRARLSRPADPVPWNPLQERLGPPKARPGRWLRGGGNASEESPLTESGTS